MVGLATAAADFIIHSATMAIKDLYLLVTTQIVDTMGAAWFVDLWNNQPDHPEKESMLVPAAYIDLQAERKNIQIGGRGQLVTATVTIYIVQALYSDAHNGSPDQSNALVCLDNVGLIYRAMQGFGGSEQMYLRAPMQCIADGSEQSGAGVWVYKQVYTCQFLDNSLA